MLTRILLSEFVPLQRRAILTDHPHDPSRSGNYLCSLAKPAGHAKSLMERKPCRSFRFVVARPVGPDPDLLGTEHVPTPVNIESSTRPFQSRQRVQTPAVLRGGRPSTPLVPYDRRPFQRSDACPL